MVAEHHYLVVPNVHIGTINDLTSSDIPYLEMSEKKGIDFITSKVDNFDKNELVLGYHVPPFNSGWFSDVVKSNASQKDIKLPIGVGSTSNFISFRDALDFICLTLRCYSNF